jgi:hypothetical protein
MVPIHAQILEAARRLADPDHTFRLANLVRAVPHLNAATVRTHVASRCCVDAPAHHQSRYPYFRSIGGGFYRIQPRFRRGGRSSHRRPAWQDRLIAALGSGVDDTLLTESLRMTPTERLDTMRQAALSLESMTRR